MYTYTTIQKGADFYQKHKKNFLNGSVQKHFNLYKKVFTDISFELMTV